MKPAWLAVIALAFLGGCVSSGDAPAAPQNAADAGPDDGKAAAATDSATGTGPASAAVAADETGPYTEQYFVNGTWGVEAGNTVNVSPAGSGPSEWWQEFSFDEAQTRITIELNYTSADGVQAVDVGLATPGWALCQSVVCIGHDVTGPAGLSDGWYQSDNATVGHSWLELGKDEIQKWSNCQDQCNWKAVAYASLPVAAQVDFQLRIDVEYEGGEPS